MATTSVNRRLVGSRRRGVPPILLKAEPAGLLKPGGGGLIARMMRGYADRDIAGVTSVRVTEFLIISAGGCAWRAALDIAATKFEAGGGAERPASQEGGTVSESAMPR
jgi:hypothetical protein